MFHRSLILTAVIILTTTPAIAAGPACSNMMGTWHNQLGSTLTIKSIDLASGRVEGDYISPSGTTGQARPLLGWINSEAPHNGKDNVKVISFAVHWGQYGAITSWTGYCRDYKGVPTITSLWHLVRPTSDFSWDHIVTDSDIFTPGPP